MRVVILFLVVGTATARAQAPGDDAAPPPPPETVSPPEGSYVRAQTTARVKFLSTTELQWDVTIDRQLACATPCEINVPELGFVTLHSHEDRPTRLEVGYLPQGGDLVIAAEPMHDAQYATGVTFTALGGAALATGITLGAVGYGVNSSGMKTAGYACVIPGAVVLAGAIWLVNRASPHAHVRLSGTF